MTDHDDLDAASPADEDDSFDELPDATSPTDETVDELPDATSPTDETVDELPEDLDLTALELPYLFPNNNRRRLAGVLHLAVAAVFIGVWAVAGDSPLANRGFLVAGLGIAGLGLYSLASGWNLAHDEVDALAVAAAEVGFPVGHASAQLAWRGLLGRPTWRILVYSNEPQPDRRGLVLVDGTDGTVLDSIVEPNPEDWSELTP